MIIEFVIGVVVIAVIALGVLCYSNIVKALPKLSTQKANLELFTLIGLGDLSVGGKQEIFKHYTSDNCFDSLWEAAASYYVMFFQRFTGEFLAARTFKKEDYINASCLSQNDLLDHLSRPQSWGSLVDDEGDLQSRLSVALYMLDGVPLLDEKLNGKKII